MPNVELSVEFDFGELAERLARIEARLAAVEERLDRALEVNELWDGS